jgi:hypothetical protein
MLFVHGKVVQGGILNAAHLLPAIAFNYFVKKILQNLAVFFYKGPAE